MIAQKHPSCGVATFIVCFLSIIFISVFPIQAQEAQASGPSTNMAVQVRGSTDASSSSLSVIKEDELGKIGSWRATAGVNAQGEHLTLIRLSGKNPALTTAGNENDPDLVISCKLNDTSLYIDWKTPVSTSDGINADIEYALDQNDPVEANWRLSSDRKMIFSHGAIKFIKSLNNANKLFIELTPYGQQKTGVSFSLDGIDEVLKLIGERCYH